MTGPAAPPVDMAARIGAAYRKSFTQMSEDRARDPRVLTLSGLGRCTRKAAYQTAGTPVSDVYPPGEHRAANLGTILHDRVVPLMARQLGGLFEQPVVLNAAGLKIKGTYDVWEPEAGDLLDVKTVGENRLGTVRRFGAFREHRAQGFGYGLALHQAGHKVKSVSFLYMDRSRGDFEVVSLPFTTGWALRAIRRVEEIQYHAGDPDNAPRDPDGRSRRIGPGWSFECNDCPFLRRCWGPDAKPGNTDLESQRPVTDQEVEAICAALVKSRDIATEAGKDVDFYRARLRHVTTGVYGRYRVEQTTGHEREDPQAMREALASRNIAVPKTRVAGTTSVGMAAAAPVKQTPEEGQ